jgi:CDP-4-dehydro-6-deoxyglucose reductase/ferredoxin-NAD(P)+ reductase (naphthalene dioxygenase ferredoxin-specific)
MSSTVKITQWPTPITVDADRTILEVALAEGVPYPHGCRSGNCGACKSRLYAGKVDMLPYSDFALSAEESASGFVLACRSRPEGDVELAWQQDDAEMIAHPLCKLSCTVATIDDMTHDIKRLRLQPANGVRLEFSAGQYASLTFAGQLPRDYSMASHPDEALLEFHVRAIEDGSVSHYVANTLKPGDAVDLEGPYGSSYLREQHRGPIIAVAGGSGLAPIKSIVESALNKGMPQPIYLYFGARDLRDIYLDEHFLALADKHPSLRLITVLSAPSKATAHRTGLVGDALGRDFDDFDGCKAYVAGPPVMVEAVTEIMKIRDIRTEDIHADPFYTEAEKPANLQAE